MSPLLTELAALVCKRGVALGALTQPQRELALAVPARALPAGASFIEIEVNVALRLALAGPAAFIETDHVELRRWLVDTGWWRRDGYGRAYERVPTAGLRPSLQAIDAALDAIDLPHWIAERVAQQQAARDARRAAWSERQSEEPND